MGIQLNPSTPVAGYDPKFDANQVAQNFNREVEVLPPPLYPSWLYITFKCKKRNTFKSDVQST